MAKVKSFSDFLKNHSSNPELHKKAWKAGKVDWKDYKENPDHYYAANTGSVPGMIYYHDTVSFGKRNQGLIHDALKDFESDCGPLDIPKFRDDETTYYNWLAWFAWEHMAGELQGYLEN